MSKLGIVVLHCEQSIVLKKEEVLNAILKGKVKFSVLSILYLL